MPEQIQKPLIEKPEHKQVHDESGPKIPNISKPDTTQKTNEWRLGPVASSSRVKRSERYPYPFNRRASKETKDG
jgi:hypothetical protein